MNRIPMIAVRDISYFEGRSVKAEEQFESDEKDVHILEVAGLARRYERQPAQKRGRYNRRDMTAEGTRDLTSESAE